MKKAVLFLAFAVFAFPVFAQQTVSRTAAKKETVRDTSIRLSDERKRALLASRNAAARQKKTILVLPPTAKDAKQLEADFLSEMEGKQLYRVDLSSIVSKYIGETEKNLARLFERAASERLILFFDEADALFGKSQDPTALAAHIQTLGLKKNVLSIFWCEKDCLGSLKKTRHTILQ